MNKILAIIITMFLPVTGALLELLSPEQAFHTTALCTFPLLLIFKPAFICSYFGEGAGPIVIGWIAFIAIFTQVFIFPIWFGWR